MAYFVQEGNMLTMGLRMGILGPRYTITKFLKGSPETKLTKKYRRLVSKSCSNMFHPSYMHSFSVTENYFVMIEQPLTVSVTGILSALMKG